MDRVPDRHEDAKTAEVDAAAGTRAKLRQLLAALDELNPLTFREGPHTILERYLERTGQVLDLIAADTLESKRTVTNIASFLRFAADWQAANPNGTLAGFVAYLDAYQAAGGELPTSVELSEDVDGVRLMTLYQAKGLEFPIVFVPNLLDGEWPVEGAGRRPLPARPAARGRARRRHPHGRGAPAAVRGDDPRAGPADPDHARWADGARRRRRGSSARSWTGPGSSSDGSTGRRRRRASTNAPALDGADGRRRRSSTPTTDIDRQVAAVRRVMPLPSARERRLALRLRASELVGLMEATERSPTPKRRPPATTWRPSWRPSPARPPRPPTRRAPRASTR